MFIPRILQVDKEQSDKPNAMINNMRQGLSTALTKRQYAPSVSRICHTKIKPQKKAKRNIQIGSDIGLAYEHFSKGNLS